MVSKIPHQYASTGFLTLSQQCPSLHTLLSWGKDGSQEVQQGQVLALVTQGVPGPGQPNIVEVGGLEEPHWAMHGWMELEMRHWGCPGKHEQWRSLSARGIDLGRIFFKQLAGDLGTSRTKSSPCMGWGETCWTKYGEQEKSWRWAWLACYLREIPAAMLAGWIGVNFSCRLMTKPIYF